MRSPRPRPVASRLLAGAAAAVIPFASFGLFVRCGADRLMNAPRRLASEAGLGPEIDALGGEVVRLRSRDGTRLAGRWLGATPGAAPGSQADAPPWRVDAHEAILLLHGWSGSVAPDLVEYAPFLRRTAGVLGLDFGGHGDSDDAPTTFGWREVEDVAGALTWLGERGIRRVALVGSSMGGMTAIASVGILGDGSLVAADVDPDAAVLRSSPPRPRIVAVVGDSVSPDLVTAVAARLRGPVRRLVAARLFDGMAARLGADPRATEPIRMVGLVEPVPLLLIAGSQDATVPLAAARRLADAAGPAHRLLVLPGAGHSGGHRSDPAVYEAAVEAFLREALTAARGAGAILSGPSLRPSSGPGGSD